MMRVVRISSLSVIRNRILKTALTSVTTVQFKKADLSSASDRFPLVRRCFSSEGGALDVAAEPSTPPSTSSTETAAGSGPSVSAEVNLAKNHSVKMREFAPAGGEAKGKWKMLLKYIADNSHEFDSLDYKAAFVQLGRLSTNGNHIRKDERFTTFLSEFDKKFEEGGWKFMNSKSSGAVSHALQQLKTESPAVLRTVLENPPHFVFHATRQRNPLVLSTFSSAFMFSKNQGAWDTSDFFKAIDQNFVKDMIVEEVKSDNARMDPLSKTMFAAAMLGHTLPRHCGAIAGDEDLHEKLLSSYPEDISKVIFSMAKMRHKFTRLAEKIKSREDVMQKLLKGRPMELARTAWAMTDTGSDASKFLEEIESSERIQQKIADDASLSDVVNILVAFSKNKPAHIAPNLLSKLEEKGVKARRNNSSGPISYFDKMVLRATPKEIADACWALADARAYVPAFAVSVRRHANHKLSIDASCHDVADILFYMTKLNSNGSFEKEFYEVTAKKHLKRLETEGMAHSMSNALWAFAIAGRVREHEAKIRSLWQKVTSMDGDDFYEDDWKHLRQAQIMALHTEGIALESDRKELRAAESQSGGFTAYGHDPGHKIGKLKSRAKSKFDKAIVEELTNLGYKSFYRGWHVIEDSSNKLPLTDVDIAWNLPANSEEEEEGGRASNKVALELDDYANFLHDLSGMKVVKRDMGTTAKSKLLKSLGWRVTHLSSSHWEIIRKRPESEKRSFWSNKLSPFGVLNSWEQEWGDGGDDANNKNDVIN